MPPPITEPQMPRRRLSWRLASFLVVAVLAALWYFLYASGATDRGGVPGSRGTVVGGPTTPVSVATVGLGRIETTIDAIGTVTALNTVTVLSRVSGVLDAVYFSEGRRVSAGDLLAQIDPRPYQVELDQAIGTRERNQAQLDNALRDLKRYEMLYERNSLARQQLDTQRALVAQYLGTKKSDEAAVAGARLQLSFTRITAPLAGIVGMRQVDPGNLISASGASGLVVITQVRPISVIFSLSQAQLPAVRAEVRAGRQLAVDLYDRSGANKIASGTLASVDNQIDVATGTVKLRALFANDDEALFPNEFVNVVLRVRADDGAVTIPTSAVQQGSDGSFVYEVEDGKAHVRPIVIGTVDGDRIAILGGLRPGQRVVVVGVDRLREGAAVKVIASDAAGAASP